MGDQAKRWLQLVDAMEASRIHEWSPEDRKDAIAALLQQFQDGGPIFPLEPPRPAISDEEISRIGKELRERYWGKRAPAAGSHVGPEE